jgi:hypothetical protein
VQIEKPIVVGDVIFRPFAEVLALAGTRRAQLELFGSIYVDGYTLALARRRGELAPRLYPAVAFVTENDERARHAHYDRPASTAWLARERGAAAG